MFLQQPDLTFQLIWEWPAWGPTRVLGPCMFHQNCFVC
jgi:hypothetical protein